MIQISGNDPIQKLLLKYEWSRTLLILLLCLFVSFIPLGFSYLEGNFINKGLKIYALSDIGYHNQFLLLLPFFIWFTRYYLNGFPAALEELKSEHIVKISEENYITFQSDTNKLLKKKIITYGPYLIGISVTIFSLFTYQLGKINSWNSPVSSPLSSIATILSLAPTFLLYYFISALILRVISIHYIIKNFFRYGVNVQPIHPDGCGGLYPLGKYSMRITTAGVGVGFTCVFGILANYYQYNFPVISSPNLLIIFGYILGLSIVFFFPLLPARKAMLDAKSNEISTIACHFNRIHNDVRNQLKNMDNSHYNFSHLKELSELYKIAQAMPVYPFNTKNLLKFVSSMLWPLILVVIQYLINKF